MRWDLFWIGVFMVIVLVLAVGGISRLPLGTEITGRPVVVQPPSCDTQSGDSNEPHNQHRF